MNVRSVMNARRVMMNVRRAQTNAGRTIPCLRTLSTAGPAVKEHSERMVFPYSPAQVYDVVRDVEKYWQFVPWCTSSSVVEGPSSLTAELEVGFGVFTERYTSLVTLDPPKSIVVSSIDTSVLDFLETKWHFLPKANDPDACWVIFNIQFRFTSEVYDQVIQHRGERGEKNSHYGCVYGHSRHHHHHTAEVNTNTTTPPALPRCTVVRNPAHTCAQASALFMDQVVRAMTKAFKDRCKAIYGAR